MRRLLNGVIILAVFGLAWWATRPKPTPVLEATKPAVAVPAAQAGERSVPVRPPSAAPAVSAPPAPDPDRSTLLDDLNQPSGTIQSDLRLLQELFAAWRTNFPRDGNPVGENVEITRALTGANNLNLALVPKDHPAINRGGELTDRWGTPFRFHQLSGTRMEIRSAGPDRRFGTDDDSVLTP